jgi:hypothetical protein
VYINADIGTGIDAGNHQIDRSIQERVTGDFYTVCRRSQYRVSGELRIHCYRLYGKRLDIGNAVTGAGTTGIGGYYHDLPQFAKIRVEGTESRGTNTIVIGQ